MRSLYKTIASFVIITGGLMVGESRAAAEEAPKIDRFRAYLLWEETGELSKDVANQEYIESFMRDKDSGRIKGSAQMLIDVVVKAKAFSEYIDGVQPFINVVVTDSTVAQPIVNVAYPVVSMPYNGQLVRTVLVDHKCSGFTLKASVVMGNKTMSEMTKYFSVSCGD